MPDVLDSILREHRTITEVLNVLEAQVDLFEQADQPDYDLIREIIDYFRTFPDLYHHPKEDLMFERLKAKDAASVRPFGNLEALHDEISERLGDFSRAVSRVMMEAEMPRDTFVKLAREFIAGERAHMKAEEQHFFPVAAKLLNKDDWSEIDKIIEKFQDPLLDPATNSRFSLLREQVSALKAPEPVA